MRVSRGEARVIHVQGDEGGRVRLRVAPGLRLEARSGAGAQEEGEAGSGCGGGGGGGESGVDGGHGVAVSLAGLRMGWREFLRRDSTTRNGAMLTRIADEVIMQS